VFRLKANESLMPAQWLEAQFERPDSAQSCRRVMPPKMCVSSNPARTSSTIMTSPMRAPRRVVGDRLGSRSGGCQWSGFLIGDFYTELFASSWRLIKQRGAVCQSNVAESVVLLVSIGSRYANGGNASTGCRCLDIGFGELVSGAINRRVVLCEKGRREYA
jgi:hypothetical protein